MAWRLGESRTRRRAGPDRGILAALHKAARARRLSNLDNNASNAGWMMRARPLSIIDSDAGAGAGPSKESFPCFPISMRRVSGGRRQFRHRRPRPAFAARGAQVTIASRHRAGSMRRCRRCRRWGRPMPVPARASPARCSTSPTTQPWPPSSPGRALGPCRHLRRPDRDRAGAPAATGRCLRRARQQVLGRLPRARAVPIRARGSLTLVSGYLGIRPSKASVLQGAINAALDALGRGLALELSPVRVNTVSPGLIATPLWDKLDPAARRPCTTPPRGCRRNAWGSPKTSPMPSCTRPAPLCDRLHCAGRRRRAIA